MPKNYEKVIINENDVLTFCPRYCIIIGRVM